MNNLENNTLEIWTDGGCKGNPGKGGVGILMKYKEHTKQIKGYIPHTTNNQMELLAVIIALESLKPNPCKIILWTDSKYVKNGITEWIINWKKNNWKTSNKKPVKNQKLWRKVDMLTSKYDLEFKWLKGHSISEENEKADSLCNESINNESPLLSNYLYLLND